MAVVALISGYDSPGTTTSAVALAACWPGGVVLADCDPRGGDVAVGWCGPQLFGGELSAEVGVRSFLQATWRGYPATAQSLASHLQSPANAPGVEVLVGVPNLEEGMGVGSGWQQVAAALADTSRTSSVPGTGRDVVMDCGDVDLHTPWPLLESADLVLLVARPTQLEPAARAIRRVARRVAVSRLALLACASDPAGTTALIEATGLLPAAELPDDLTGALPVLHALIEWEPARFERTALGRVAGRAARRLHRRLHARYDEADMFIGYYPPVGSL